MNSCGCGRFALGMAMGMAAGMAVGMTMSPKRREMKKMADQAVESVSKAMSHLVDSMG